VLEGRNPTQVKRFWLWAASDNLRLYAQNAVECALELRRLRPQGTVQ
jgi:aspartate-semialdehyde dehydrogenase